MPLKATIFSGSSPRHCLGYWFKGITSPTSMAMKSFYPTSDIHAASQHQAVGLSRSPHGHYNGRSHPTAPLAEGVAQASQGTHGRVVDDILHVERTHSIHPSKIHPCFPHFRKAQMPSQHPCPQQFENFVQDTVPAPRPELDVSPMSAHLLASEALNQRDIGTLPVAGNHGQAPGSLNRSISWDEQDYRGYINAKVLDSQSSRSYVDSHYQHGRGAGLTQYKTSISDGSPGSNYSAPLNKFPLSGNQSWNNSATIAEQGGYENWSNAKHSIVDGLWTVVNPQIPQDALHGRKSTAMPHELVDGRVLLPQSESSDYDPDVSNKQMPDFRTPYYDANVPFQEYGDTTANASVPPHLLDLRTIVLQSESNHNARNQHCSPHHAVTSVTGLTQAMGRNILESIPTDPVNYSAYAHQRQCSCIVDRNTVLRTNHRNLPHNAIPEVMPNESAPTPTARVGPTSSPKQSNNDVFPSSQALPGTNCSWRDETGSVCGHWVTSKDCATHLADYHWIKDISSRRKIECKACDPPNTVKRGSILRHFMEVHLGIKRKLSKKRGTKRNSRTAHHSPPGA
ncbi:hypothetical protein J3A83DRAFT_4455320 [Scleroderma citrinum]